ncbi:MAG: aminotransferase class I/II-fold pyridoxal phosphate-dependent enzyme [Paracoccaceae bacterium]
MVDVDAILAAVTDRTQRSCWPTRQPHRHSCPRAIWSGWPMLPAHVILVIDSAYAEFAEGYDGGAALAETRPNVLMTRTFSRSTGSAGCASAGDTARAR